MSILLGSYKVAAFSGVIGAGLGSAAPVFSFRWTNAFAQCALKGIRISAGDSSTAFTAGNFTFNAFFARAFTAVDTGGTSFTPAGNDGKFRTAHPNSLVGNIQIANTGTLSAGTRTLDAVPFASIAASDQATAGNDILAPTDMYKWRYGETFPVFYANEGFVIQATVPATGTWILSVEPQWDEGTGF